MSYISELYESMFEIPEEYDGCKCDPTGVYAGNGEFLGDSGLVFLEQAHIDDIDDICEYAWDSYLRGTGITGVLDGFVPDAGISCMNMYREGSWPTKTEFVDFGVNYMDNCPEEAKESLPASYFEEGEALSEAAAKGFESITITTEDEYGFFSEWDFKTKDITDSDPVFDDLDSGEVGIMYERAGNETCTGCRSGYTSYYKIYSAVFEHDEPVFNNPQAVDATTYTIEPALDEIELTGEDAGDFSLGDLYGETETSISDLLDSVMGEIADAVSTEMTETALLSNKIKYVPIDEDMFDAFGAEEGKEAVSVSTTMEVTYDDEET